MNGNELLKKLKDLAKERGQQLEIIKKRGKGSHVTVYLGNRCTVLKDRKGLLDAMLEQLGLSKNDL